MVGGVGLKYFGGGANLNEEEIMGLRRCDCGRWDGQEDR